MYYSLFRDPAVLDKSKEPRFAQMLHNFIQSFSKKQVDSDPWQLIEILLGSESDSNPDIFSLDLSCKLRIYRLQIENKSRIDADIIEQMAQHVLQSEVIGRFPLVLPDIMGLVCFSVTIICRNPSFSVGGHLNLLMTQINHAIQATLCADTLPQTVVMFLLEGSPQQKEALQESFDQMLHALQVWDQEHQQPLERVFDIQVFCALATCIQLIFNGQSAGACAAVLHSVAPISIATGHHHARAVDDFQRICHVLQYVKGALWDADEKLSYSALSHIRRELTAECSSFHDLCAMEALFASSTGLFMHCDMLLLVAARC